MRESPEIGGFRAGPRTGRPECARSPIRDPRPWRAGNFALPSTPSNEVRLYRRLRNKSRSYIEVTDSVSTPICLMTVDAGRLWTNPRACITAGHTPHRRQRRPLSWGH